MDDITAEDWRDYFNYLDELRESGITNMFGARPFIMNRFFMGEKKAGHVLTTWMSCDLQAPMDRRVADAMIAAEATQAKE